MNPVNRLQVRRQLLSATIMGQARIDPSTLATSMFKSLFACRLVVITTAQLIQTMTAAPQSSRRTAGFLLVIASLMAASSHAFVSPPGVAFSSSKSPITNHAEASVVEDKSDVGYVVKVVEGGEDDSTVVDVAAYRNNLVNPQMMVDRAQKKRDAIDTSKAAIDGLKVGLLYVGPIIGIGTYFTATGDNALTSALTNYGTSNFLYRTLFLQP